MAKTMRIQQIILHDVEQAMLLGFTRPYQIVKRVEGIADHRVAGLYIDAVRTRWAIETKDRPKIRERLFNEAKGQKERLQAKLERTKNAPIGIALEKTILKAREQESELAGLKEQKLILEKSESPYDRLSDEEVQQEFLGSLPNEAIKQEAIKRFKEVKELYYKRVAPKLRSPKLVNTPAPTRDPNSQS